MTRRRTSKSSSAPRTVVKQQLSPWCDERKFGSRVDTIVVHSMFVAGDVAPFSLEACARLLDSLQLSAHYLIDPEGQILQLVEEEKRAWHAGRSQMPPPDGREECNHFSIGIELLGDLQVGFSDAQYLALGELCAKIARRHEIGTIAGHEHVAVPRGRKDDPGPKFDWQRLRAFLEQVRRGSDAKPICFPGLAQ